MSLNKTILITGVGGLLGSRLADWIIENKPEYNVVGVDDMTGGYIENVHPNVEFHLTDCAGASMKTIFQTHKPEYVFHFAAYAAEGLSPFIRTFNYTNNLVATANIVNNCITYGTKRLVFTSSMAVYGRGRVPFDETQIPQPIDPYGVAKFSCEQDIQIAGEQHGLDWCIVRPHNVYGIKQNIWDKYRNVLGIWMYQHLNNKPMTIFGDGTQKRAFSYIDDCLEPLWKAADDNRALRQIINLGGIKEYTINDANAILRNVIGGGEKIHIEQRHEVKYAYPTWERSVELLDYKDNTDLVDGLHNMWTWAKEQPKREQFVWNYYEIDKGLYSFWRK